jgi:hypothetical protein
VRFTAAVNAELRRLRTTGHYLPPRFFGYYFRNGRPIAVSGSWTVVLESLPPVSTLVSAVDTATEGRYSISAGNGPTEEPEYILVHDRLDGECWLWRFAAGMRFVEATDPVEVAGIPWETENRKLLEP